MPEDIATLDQSAAARRAQLGATLSALSQSIDPDRLSHTARETTSDLSDKLVSTAISTVKRNPTGVALLALGAAVFSLSPKRQSRARSPDPLDMSDQDARIAAADARIAAKAAARAGSAPDLSSGTMRSWLEAGLDRLGPDARDRVIAARLKAIEAQEAMERQVAKAAKVARDAHRSQPLVTAMAVAGVGALIGALLPSTRAESRMLGDKRDHLMRQADSILRAEVAALQDRGEDALRSGLAAAQDALSGDRRG